MRKTVKCVAVDCPNRTDKECSKEISFHGFPLDSIKKAEWVAAINRKNWKPSTQSILCSAHFKPEDLDRTSQYVRVRNNAIPSIFHHKKREVGKSKASTRKESELAIPKHRHKQTVIREYESSSEDSLELEVFPEELSDAQLNFRAKIENELEELNKKMDMLCNQPNVEVILEDEVTSSDIFTNNTSSRDRKRQRSVSRTSDMEDIPLQLNDNSLSDTKSAPTNPLPSNFESNLQVKKTTRRGRKPAIARDPNLKKIIVNETQAIGGLQVILPPVKTNDDRVVSTLRHSESNEKLHVSLTVVAEPHFGVKEFMENDRMHRNKRQRSVSRTSDMEDIPLQLNDNSPSDTKSAPTNPLPSNFESNLQVKKTTRRGRKPAIARDPNPKKIIFNETQAIGGLKVILPPVKTNDDRVVSTLRRIESNEKLHVSLTIVAEPHLRVKEFMENDRMQFDIRFKTVLTYVPKEFTEWLFKQGLLRSHQYCICHPSVELKLYIDFTKYPDSGGYTWISDCCPDKIVSVYNGSIFESSLYIPSEILKLIYHWSCHTNFKDMVQLVKVDHSHTTLVYSWLRAICTVSVQTLVGVLGGPGKKVEVGVITLMGMQLPNSDKRMKVEVLGLLEVETQKIRLRALESISEDDNHRRKQKNKVLELLSHWIHPESVIAIDATIDKEDFIKRGFSGVQQSTPGDQSPLNTSIMIYLRLILPRMFENSNPLLTINVIQQFLDELAWREWYGTTPAEAFDNIMLHISQQTDIDTSITNRLTQISLNPFMDWQSKV